MGIPVTAVVTGANVHDSQLAIPMENLTERRITHLYSVMDSAYDAEDIRAYIQGKERIALIEANRRRGKRSRAFDAAQEQRFKIRTTIERTNAHLKDWFFGANIFVRGIRKVKFHLMCGVVSLAAVKIFTVVGARAMLEAIASHVASRGHAAAFTLAGRQMDPFPCIGGADLLVVPSLFDSYPGTIL